ncbi:hypothetical protein MMC31_006980, partial [Peltigera leucophlebia]|nr:hypothetical protein [Peltigera leucophlebia]
MSGSFEKSVKGGTKIKLAAPKSKYVEHILVATHAGEAGVAEIFRALQNRLRDSTWTIVFKSLIIVHLMVREGEPQVTLKFLADSPNKLAISDFSDVQVQGSNIGHYYTYLLARAKAYRETRIDWVREGTGRLKKQTIDKGLLRETEIVQNQISALLKCDLLNNEPENEITLTAFRLLTMDLLVLFHVMNEGTINVLEHYFEMSKYDAKRALGIYKTFARQTNQVVEYLSIARTYENSTRLEIPKLKHAPTGLTSSLEEYLNDPDFEINRRQYLAQQEAKKGKKSATNGKGESSTSASKPASSKKLDTSQSSQSPPGPPPPAKTEAKTVPTADLIDLFDSIEQNQQPMATQPQQQSQNFQLGSQFFPSPPNQQSQQLGFPSPPQGYPIQNGQPQSQGSNAFPSPPQGIPAQNGQPQQQSSNPFPSSPQGFPTLNGQSQQSTNPFGNMDSNPFGLPQQQQPLQQMYTGSGFGGYTQKPFNQQPDISAGTQQQNTALLNFAPSTFAQPPQQQQQQQQQYPFNTGPQPQSTNPFRQSVMPQNTGPTSPSSFPMPPLPTSQPTYQSTSQSTNPFARNVTSQPTGNTSIVQAPNSNNLNSAFHQPPTSTTPFS